MNKHDAIKLWMTEHHPEMAVEFRGTDRPNGDGWCMIVLPNCKDVLVEIDFYNDEPDKMYAYPRHISGTITQIFPLFEAHMADPTYFQIVEEFLRRAPTMDTLIPPKKDGEPLWTTSINPYIT